MVTEFRRLVFSSNDMKIAIKTFNKDKARQLPAGDILEYKIIDEPNISCRVRVGDVNDSSKDQEVVVDASYLGAALIHHCLQNKIPLPKSAKKNLECAGDGLALSLTINAYPQAVSYTDN